MKKETLRIMSIIFYLCSTWFVGCGFHKLFIYKNNESLSLTKENINAYVGGDAYNYIINSNRAVAYFILALLFTIIASTCVIVRRLDTN